jgi:hypothetical protein
LREAIFDLVTAQQPMTVRQVFYRGVGFGLWNKTEADYKNVVCRLLADMRRDGDIPYTWIADGTRWMRKPTTFDSMQAALQNTAATYRRSLWSSQDTYVEVWLEKEALAGVIVDVTDPWDVPLMVTRGYPSLSFLYTAAETIKAYTTTQVPPGEGKPSELKTAIDEVLTSLSERYGWDPNEPPTFPRQNKSVRILYLGDRDPSGDDIARNVAQQLEDMSECAIDFVRVAVTAEQVDEYQLPLRPTKASDSRTRSWSGDGSVEVDAIEPDSLRQLVIDEIESCIDQHELEVVLAAEAEERATVRRLVEREFVA